MYRMALSIGITFLMKNEVRGIIRFAIYISNAAYMGFPYSKAMYGFRRCTVYERMLQCLIFFIYCWNCVCFREYEFQGIVKKIVTCPPIISVAIGLVIFLARIPVADILKDTFNVVGA